MIIIAIPFHCIKKVQLHNKLLHNQTSIFEFLTFAIVNSAQATDKTNTYKSATKLNNMKVFNKFFTWIKPGLPIHRYWVAGSTKQNRISVDDL